MHRAPLVIGLMALIAAFASHAVEPGCVMPKEIEGRRFTNLSDAAWRPDNPHAGRMVRVDFSGGRYLLSVLGSRQRHHGSYTYTRLAPTISVIDMHEAFEAGDSRYQLVLICLTPLKGRFVFTQSSGPVVPEHRQNGGIWTLQPR